MRILSLFTLLFILTPTLCFAQEAMSNTLPPGGTVLNISATESVEVDQDLLVANLRVEKTLSDPKELQQEINMMMKQAIEEAKNIEGLDLSTNQYYVYEYNTKTEKLWRGNQGLTIKSKNADDVLELSGRLQDAGFLMNGLNYQLSPEKHEEVRESLLETALEKLITRSQRVGTAIDKPNVDLWEVNVDAAPSPIYPQPMMQTRMASMEMDSAMAAPVAQAGKDQISLTVSAKVILK